MATTIKNVLHVSTGPERGRQVMASAGQDRAAGTYGQTIAVGVRVGVSSASIAPAERLPW